MAKARVVAQTKRPKDVVRRNIALLDDLMRYLLAEPRVLGSLPDNFELVILPEDDPEIRLYNLQLLDTHKSEGSPVVFVRLKTKGRTHRTVRPSIYVPLVA